MAYLSAVELNGLIYVAGHIDPARKYPSNFWFYDPDQNEWTVNEQIDYSYPYITKVKENICIFNGKAGFKMYDLAMDHWKPVNKISLLSNLYIMKEKIQKYSRWNQFYMDRLTSRNQITIWLEHLNWKTQFMQ